MPSLNSPIYTSARERRQICAENRVEAFIFLTIHRAPRGTEERGSPSPPLWKRFSTVHVRTTNARRNKHVCFFFSGNSPDSLSISLPLSIHLAYARVRQPRNFYHISTLHVRRCCCCCWPGYFPLVTSSGCTRQGTGERVVQPTMYPRATQEPVYTCYTAIQSATVRWSVARYGLALRCTLIPRARKPHPVHDAFLPLQPFQINNTAVRGGRHRRRAISYLSGQISLVTRRDLIKPYLRSTDR